MHRHFLSVILFLIAAGSSAQPADLAAHARKLPPLPAQDGKVAILNDSEAFRWRPLREGVNVEQGSGFLRAAYKVVSGKPAGAALVVGSNALDGVKSLRIRLGANRNVPLIVSLLDSHGVVYAFPALNARATARNYELFVVDLSFLPQQSRAEDPGSYRIGDTVMISIVDVTGFMSSETPEVEWTLESAEGVR